MLIFEIVKAVTLMAILSLYSKEHLGRVRNYKYYREEEIAHNADSLLNNWAAEQMKIDTFKIKK